MNDIRSHLICEGIILNYTEWILHGELPDMPTVSHIEHVDVDIGDCIKDMLHDLGQECFWQADAPLYGKLQSDSKKPLYLGCISFTRLSTVLDLVNLKARFRWSDKSFIELFVVLKKMLPEDNALSKNHFEEKKILCPMGMKYQKIHACLNGCILYKNQFSEMHKYPTCGVSRYKVKDDECSDDATTNNGLPKKVCRYLQLIIRFKRLFANEHDTKNLTWHADSRKSDGLLQHLVDSP